jgi:hypothetical protein
MVTQMMCLLLIGCAPARKQPEIWREKISFISQDQDVRLVIYGGLDRLLTGYDPRPAWKRFLYGPVELKLTPLRNPQGMDMLNDVLLVADQGIPAIQSINLTNGKYRFFGDIDHQPRCPVDVTVGPDRKVYVADTTLRSVLVYRSDGQWLDELNLPAANDTFRPCALAAGHEILYVANQKQGRIERWSYAQQRWLSPFSPPPGRQGIIAPTGLYLHDDALFIVDAVQARVFRVTRDGQWLSAIGRPGRGQGQFIRPKQICVSNDLLFVTDAGRQSVQVFNLEGDFINELFAHNSEWSGWTLPTGLLTLSTQDLQPVFAAQPETPENLPDHWVLVSDTLGVPSLNLIGIFQDREKGGSHAD